MSRNRDIRGFFANPGGRSSSQSLPVFSSQPARDPHSSISTPSTPPKPTTKPRDRTEEIKGSDDDGDSDDSLESISAFIERKAGPAPYQRDPNLATPTAKRIASSSTSHLKSPLTIQPKQKFSLRDLIKHAQQSDRVDESARRADELINQSEDDSDNSQILTDVQNDPTLLQKTAKELLNNDDSEDTKGDKLVRAMNRTKVDGIRKQCYFFNLEQPLIKPPRALFPQKGAKGCWSCLANSSTRNQAIILGLPHTIASKGRTLPDELLLWILNEVCVEKNAQLRMQYCNLVTLCPSSITRLVTDVQLYSMLEKLGGPKYPRKQDAVKFQSVQKVEDLYRRRDWTGLVAFLELLEQMAPRLKTQNVIGAILLLLRMGLDPLVSTTVRSEHAAAMEALVEAISRLNTHRWNEACNTISSYIYKSVDEPLHQVIPISHTPTTTAKLLDLRRRMAAVTLFRDPELGSKPVDETLTLNDIMERLDSDDFRVGATNDFDNLRALVTLLDIVISGAGFLKRQHSTNEDADRKFDADIDRLTFRLKLIHDKIHDSTVLSRKMAKACIDLLSKRLTYSVRTRPPPKTSIFDPEPKEDTNIPKQRAFMKNWAQKKAERNAAALASKSGDVNGSKK
ncbi:uncharacterized protein F4822DRAFT_129471 [Hypoxylon trugodes]|uniref:uncharacterized protein n=1 Tax=Hypoxylon trugodes TaxID=326681 RepID=UPI002195DB55|nr:uncharacterized protein F4822DRAFT_129471 [Hypoxylon trugodes]KAI1392436.1 hypothetical protein F4822DRAFT_129471 [Hypoxylon trugodes]